MMRSHYAISDLAMAYFPLCSTPRNAQRCFMRLLKSEKDLWQQLKQLHFHAYQHTLTPKQYEAIINVLGEPDDVPDML